MKYPMPRRGWAHAATAATDGGVDPHQRVVRAGVSHDDLGQVIHRMISVRPRMVRVALAENVRTANRSKGLGVHNSLKSGGRPVSVL